MTVHNFSKDPIFKDIIDLIQTNKLDEAKKKLEEVYNSLKFRDDFFTTFLLGTVCGKLGEVDDSINFFKKSINLNKEFDPAYYNLGLIYFKSKKFQDAFHYFEKGFSINCNNYDCLFMLAEINQEQDKNDQAIEIYKKCIRLDPEKVDAYLALSNLYLSINCNVEAEDNLSQVFPKFKNNFKFLNNFGLILKNTGKLDLAVTIFYEALKIKADEKEPLINISLCYLEKNEYQKALEVIDKAIAIDNKSLDAYFSKSLIFERNNQLENSLNCLEHCLEIDANFLKAIVGIIQINIKLLNFSNINNLFENLDLEKLDTESLGLMIFYSNYIPNFKSLKYLQLTSIYNKKIKDKNFSYIKKFSLEKKNFNSKVSKKIKLGFVSGDLNKHPVCFQLKDFFLKLSKDNDFECYIYDNSEKEDNLTLELKKNLPNWFKINNISDYDVSKKIFSNQINILFDLSGHTSRNRLGIFLFKPAEIQISWAGYAKSVGIDGIDFILADPYVIPSSKNFENLYTEKIIRLNNCWSTLSAITSGDEDNHNILPFSKNNFLTIGSINNYMKYNNEVLDVWSNILKSTENTCIYLSGNKMFNNLCFKEKFLNFFKKKNIDPKRVTLEGVLDRDESLKNYTKIDFCLDPFPYNGGTTSFEAALMCVPVLTLVGDVFVSRCGYSINMNLDINEWNSYSKEEYLSKAIDYSKSPDFILKTKKKIYENVYIKKLLSSDIFFINFKELIIKLYNKNL